MCLIIDANCLSAVFASPTPPDFQPLHKWIKKGKGSLVTGGKNKIELFRCEKARLAISEWNRSGKAFYLDDRDIAIKEIELRKANIMRSDDSHVLALAIISGARWLCSTGDDALCDDFKDRRLVPRPRGRIYKYAQDGRRLCHTPSCHYSRLLMRQVP